MPSDLLVPADEVVEGSFRNATIDGGNWALRVISDIFADSV
jgi:hypothetical protein